MNNEVKKWLTGDKEHKCLGKMNTNLLYSVMLRQKINENIFSHESE